MGAQTIWETILLNNLVEVKDLAHGKDSNFAILLFYHLAILIGETI